MLFAFSSSFTPATDYGKMSRHFEKKVKSNSHWSVTINSETANLDESECRKINSHLEIYTKYIYIYIYIYMFKKVSNSL